MGPDAAGNRDPGRGDAKTVTRAAASR